MFSHFFTSTEDHSLSCRLYIENYDNWRLGWWPSQTVIILKWFIRIYQNKGPVFSKYIGVCCNFLFCIYIYVDVLIFIFCDNREFSCIQYVAVIVKHIFSWDWKVILDLFFFSLETKNFILNRRLIHNLIRRYQPTRDLSLYCIEIFLFMIFLGIPLLP